MPRPVSYRTCAICARPTVSPYSPYCTRCRGHLYNRPENAKRRAALREAHDGRLDVFRSCWSRAILVLDDPDDPFGLCYDREAPTKTADLIACSKLFRSLRVGLTPKNVEYVINSFGCIRYPWRNPNAIARKGPDLG